MSAVDLDDQAERRVSLFLRPKTELPTDEETYALGLTPLKRRGANHLDLSEWKDRHGARLEDIKDVLGYAASHGIDVLDEPSELRRRIALSGSRSKLHALCLDPDIRRCISSVTGLDNPAPIQAPAGAPRGSVYGDSPPHGVKPHHLQSVTEFYNFPIELDGKGQTTAIIELHGGYTKTGMEAYFKGLRIEMPTFVDVSVNGGKNNPAGKIARNAQRNVEALVSLAKRGEHAAIDALARLASHGVKVQEDGEPVLDLQVIGAIVPRAKLVVYFADSASNRSYVDAVSAAVFDQEHLPSVISLSWGAPEDDWSTQERKAMDDVLKAAAWLGITVCACTGDHGYSTLDGMSDALDDRAPARVEYPASSPFVLACGGTRLEPLDGGMHEVAWGGTGGGFSRHYRLPSWQKKAGVSPLDWPPGPLASASNRFAGRGVPDVAGHADGNFGYVFHFDGQMSVHAGTSAVAPLWSALITQLNQSLGRTNGRARAGYLNPILYEKVAPACFHPVISGGNGLYGAKLGWNPCTGNGSPDGTRLIQVLMALDDEEPKPT
jgi:kumamolisin